jgi:hypothetical protein
MMCHADESRLPLHLRLTEPLDLDQLPLQVALLTMELATVRMQLGRLAGMWAGLNLPAGGFPAGFDERPPDNGA